VPGSGTTADGLGDLHGVSEGEAGPEQLLPFCFEGGWPPNTKSNDVGVAPVVAKGEARAAPSAPAGVGSADGEKNVKATGVNIRSAKVNGFSNSSGGGS
jgi:hypothetical protein